MAEGRMLKRKIALDRRVAQLSPCSALLFLQSIPHLDREGRMAGSPVAVRGTVVPARAEARPENWTDERIASYIAEWMGVTDEESGLPRPLALHYCVRGVWVCQFLGFHKNQKLRWDRERPSSLPEPPSTLLEWLKGEAVSPNQLALDAASGIPPAMPLREPTPDKLWQPPGLEVEVEVQEVQDLTPAAVESEVLGQAARAREGRLLEEILEMFEEIFQVPARLSEARRPRLARAVEPLNDGEVRRLFEARLREGAQPRSIAWFLPAFEERAAELRAGLRRDEAAVERAAELAPEARVERWFAATGRFLRVDDFEDVLAELPWDEEMRGLARDLLESNWKGAVDDGEGARSVA